MTGARGLGTTEVREELARQMSPYMWDCVIQNVEAVTRRDGYKDIATTEVGACGLVITFDSGLDSRHVATLLVRAVSRYLWAKHTDPQPEFFWCIREETGLRLKFHQPKPIPTRQEEALARLDRALGGNSDSDALLDLWIARRDQGMISSTSSS